ncbi:hypothetical protein [uncultured Flavobacterium sp.]|uniref:immunity protein Imm33 domain-containing protein n=1 Tax=uncultured Flavobacterium sp. TaxID=165435 RepID=UPI0025F665C2|nr:hypothetical protein [uncultured Flavobacterium sp.]
MKEQKNKLVEIQKEICKKFGREFESAPFELKVGIALNVRNGIEPINALRHIPEGDTSGWYIWAGEYRDDSDFFKPLHISHLEEWCPLIIPYLGLSAGSRVLIAENGNYIDVWEDKSLLEI